MSESIYYYYYYYSNHVASLAKEETLSRPLPKELSQLTLRLRKLEYRRDGGVDRYGCGDGGVCWGPGVGGEVKDEANIIKPLAVL